MLFRSRKPQRVGVQFMGDLFHSDVQECFIDRVFAVMALCPQHTFLVLTKRPERMRQYLSDSAYRAERVGIDAEHLSGTDRHINDERARWPFPLPNVWMGTSVENQDVADKRIPHLLQTNAAKRWVSVEPMLGPVDLTSVRWSKIAVNPEDFRRVGAPVPYQAWSLNNVLKSRPANDLNQAKRGLNWIICGGEAGHGARPMHPDWVRSLRDQCQAAGVPFYFKQWGENIPFDNVTNNKQRDAFSKASMAGRQSYFGYCVVHGSQGLMTGTTPGVKPISFAPIGKHLSGFLLDGREWRELPR